MVYRRNILGVTAGLVLGGCAIFGTYNARYRLTLSLIKNGLTYAGTSVHESVWTSNGIFAMNSHRYNVATWADAIVVDLDDGPVFGLLHPPTRYNGHAFIATRAERVLMPALDEQLDPRSDLDRDQRMRLLNTIRGVHRVKQSQGPVLLRFLDLNDPTSAALIAPADDVTLSSFTVEITRDPVTRGITRRLPWLNELRGPDYPNLATDDHGLDNVGTQLDRRAFTLAGDEYLG